MAWYNKRRFDKINSLIKSKGIGLFGIKARGAEFIKYNGMDGTIYVLSHKKFTIRGDRATFSYGTIYIYWGKKLAGKYNISSLHGWKALK